MVLSWLPHQLDEFEGRPGLLLGMSAAAFRDTLKWKLGIDVAKSAMEKYRVRQRKPPAGALGTHS